MPRQRKSPLVIADDDPGVLQLVDSILEPDGFSVYNCRSGDAALYLLQELDPMLFVLDVGLPPGGGLVACRSIRALSDVPILVLGAEAGPRDAVSAFEAGADDFVRKPFGAEEFRSRVRALLRRSAVAVPLQERVDAGRIAFDSKRHSASVDARELDLTATEFALLGCLVRHRDRVVTHDQLLETVWGREYGECRHLLRVTMCRLRRKMGGGDELLQTVPRIGYRLRVAEKAA